MAQQEGDRLERNFQPEEGLFTDKSKQEQPANTYTFALNAVNETKEGNFGYLSNETGNNSCFSLHLTGLSTSSYLPDFHIIGHCNFLGNEVLLFLTNKDSSMSVIAIDKGDCSPLQIVLAQPCLNFSIYHQIKCIYRIRKGCNRVVYFVDAYNSDRSVDIDEILNNPTGNSYFINGVFQCALIKLEADFQIPCISFVSTSNSGGNLKLGVYQFAVALGDENLNFTNYPAITPPIPIVDGIYGTDFYKLKGGDPLQEPPTTKSINLNISNIDQNFKYIQIAVIETISGVSTGYSAIILPITSNSLNYTYTGLNTAIATILPLNLISAPRVVFDNSYTIEQHDNRLLKGNVRERNVDYATLQRAALLIQTTYTTLPLRYKDYLGSDPYGNYYSNLRSYMRDEIYALGIRAIFKDGTESAVMHIPSRAKNIRADRSGMPLTDLSVLQKKHNRQIPNSGQWDDCIYKVVDPAYTTGGVILASDEVYIDDVKHLGWSTIGANTDIGYGINRVPRWLVFNTALQTFQQSSVYQGYYSRGEMAYWESDQLYPVTKDCNGKYIYEIRDPNTNDIVESLNNTPIRHHKMPDTTLETHYINSGENGGWDEDDYIITLGIDFNLTDFQTYLSNFLPIDQFNDIVGFKIVRALRDGQNKTIIDKGIAYNNIAFYPQGTDVNQHRDWQTNVGNMYVGIINKGSQSNATGTGDFLGFQYNTNSPIIDGFPGNENAYNSDAFYGSIHGTTFTAYDLKELAIHNPRGKFLRTSYSSFVKFEKEFNCVSAFYGAIEPQNSPDNDISIRSFLNYNQTVPGFEYGTPYPGQTNRRQTAEQFIDPNDVSQVTLTNQFYNVSQEELFVAQFDNNLFDIKLDTSSTAIYAPQNHGGSPAEFGSFTPADTSHSTEGSFYIIDKCHYISLKNYITGLYGQLSSITYEDVTKCLINVGQTTTTEFQGDIFITRFGMQRSFLQQAILTTNNVDVDWRTCFTEIDTFFVESEINCSVRHLSYIPNDVASQFYPYYHSNTDIINILYHNHCFQNGGPCGSNANFCTLFTNNKYNKNLYYYNTDFSKELDDRPSFPLTQTFNYCDACINKFPHRIVYSLKSNQEELTDNFLIFLPNNYTDLPGQTGQVIDLFKKSDELFVRTLQSLWYVQTKPQEIETNQATVYVGTGEIFSIPPREIISNKTGYAGGQTRWDLVVNEQGATFADQSMGVVYNFNQQLLEISSVGMRQWFKENLPSQLLSLYPDYPFIDNPASDLGIGLIGYYDPLRRRYILTKKDYVPIDTTTTAFNGSNWIYSPSGPSSRSINNPYTAPDIFINKSWTISYSFNTKTWTSWHSYLPNYAYYNRETFITSLYNNNQSWKHQNGDYQKFYNIVFPHMFEYVDRHFPMVDKYHGEIVFKPMTIQTYEGTQYQSNTQQYDSVRQQFVEILDQTFDKGLFYNDTQSTGIIDIFFRNDNNLFGSVAPYDPASIEVVNKEKTWSLNGIRDMVNQTTIKQSIFTSNWQDIQNQYFIDKIPNMNVISYLKSQFDIERFRDNYLSCRLSFSNPNNLKIITKYITTNTDKSYR